MSSNLHPPRACVGDANALPKPGRRRLISVAAALCIFGVAAGARSETPALIGHVARLEPFAAVENGRSVGMIIDIVGAALDRAKLPYRFVPLPLDEMEAALASGKIRALAFVGATPDKRAAMDFSAAIVVTGGALFTRADQPAASLKDLALKTVATPRAGPLASQLARLAPDVKVTVTTGYDESFEAVLAGKADAAALNLQGGIRLARAKYAGKFRLPAEPFISLPLAFAVARGKDADLLRKLDEQLAAMRADGSLAAAERRWLGE